jgi:acyl carrier protein
MLSEEIVVQVVSQLLDVEEAELTADLPLAAIEGWDSVNALRVLVYLERELGVTIEYQRFMEAERLGDFWAAAPAVTP